jgi:trk system potassium uptake protein TrkH
MTDPRAGAGSHRIASSPETMLVGGFAALIALGALVLWLPWSHRGPLPFLDALFTATSAVCVTGLGTVDTGTTFTVGGQVVILVLIQTGGIGVMSIAALAFQFLRRRLPLRAGEALAGSVAQSDAGADFRRLFRGVLRFVLVAEALGAVILFAAMAPERGPAHAAWSSVFHAVSAFCNAGFSLYPDNLAGFRGHTAVLGAIMALIVVGGIGHPVAVDVWNRLRRRGSPEAGPVRLALSSKVALATSTALILGGAVLLLLFGLLQDQGTWGSRVESALFQSVTARTAGFNTVGIGALPAASLLVLVVLMFVGGSPCSCAGGIKTTTFALWLAGLRGLLRGEKRPRLFDRHIPGDVVRRASLTVGLAVLWLLAGLLVLLTTEAGRPGVGLEDVLFEHVSAFGTVGLSTGITPGLSAAGKVWIVATMFLGRLGPLTLALWAFSRAVPDVRYPEARMMVG